VSTTDNFKKGYLPWFCLLALAAIVVGFALQSVFAETLTETQSKQKKAEEYIRVAQEQIKRGLYESAQALIKQIRENYASILTESQTAAVDTLSKQAEEALEVRRKTPDIIKQAEELSAAKQYQQALSILTNLQASPYLTESDRNTVQNLIRNVEANLNEERKQAQAVYDQAVQDYLQKNYEKAKAGFMQAAQSGIEVSGSISPMDYLKMIDQIQQTPPPPQPAAAAEPAIKPQEQAAAAEPTVKPQDQIEIEIMQMIPEQPAETEQPALPAAAEQPAVAEEPPALAAEEPSAPAQTEEQPSSASQASVTEQPAPPSLTAVAAAEAAPSVPPPAIRDSGTHLQSAQ